MSTILGLCFLAHCKTPGTELIAGSYRIVLCVDHLAELEATAQGGYSLANPPREGGRPVAAWEDLTITTWWPWELRDGE